MYEQASLDSARGVVDGDYFGTWRRSTTVGSGGGGTGGGVSGGDQFPSSSIRPNNKKKNANTATAVTNNQSNSLFDDDYDIIHNDDDSLPPLPHSKFNQQQHQQQQHIQSTTRCRKSSKPAGDAKALDVPKPKGKRGGSKTKNGDDGAAGRGKVSSVGFNDPFGNDDVGDADDGIDLGVIGMIDTHGDNRNDDEQIPTLLKRVLKSGQPNKEPKPKAKGKQQQPKAPVLKNGLASKTTIAATTTKRNKNLYTPSDLLRARYELDSDSDELIETVSTTTTTTTTKDVGTSSSPPHLISNDSQSNSGKGRTVSSFNSIHNPIMVDLNEGNGGNHQTSFGNFIDDDDENLPPPPNFLATKHHKAGGGDGFSKWTHNNNGLDGDEDGDFTMNDGA
jgi:hypothetical protein